MILLKKYSRWTYYFIRHIARLPADLFLWKNNIHFTSKINRGVVVRSSSVGKYIYIGNNCSINRAGISNYCSIAPGVMIGGMEHSVDWLSTSAHLSQFNSKNNVTHIGPDVWIGANVTIKQGVKVGCGAVIGAGAVVLKDVPPYSISVGVPAKHLRFRFSDEVISELLVSKYWEEKPKLASAILEGIDS